jgi:hypothetical protein
LSIRKLAFATLALVAGLLASQTPQPLLAAATNYYVDSVSGSDNNTGTSTSNPWQTLTKVMSRHYSPGDTINFKRGSFWTGVLQIPDSGVQGSPITFRDYGTGARPTISNPGGTWAREIQVYGSYVVVQGFLVRDGGDAGVEILNGANHNTVQDIEATNTGFGVSIWGQYNLVTHNYAHDLQMHINTPTPNNDDCGAIGYLLANSDNEVSYNSCVNCRATSYDYGHDGGVVEIYGNGDNSYIHHNYGSGSNGFLEIGGGSARNVRVAYNVSDNNDDSFACLHNSGTFASTIDNFRIENNTIKNSSVTGSTMITCMDAPTTLTQLLFRNNIVVSIENVFNQSTFTHANNIYNMLNGASVGFTLASTERVTDPQFAQGMPCPFHIQASSPAIATGINLGYTLDYHGNPVSATPAIGSHEYQSTAPTGPLTPMLFLPLTRR